MDIKSEDRFWELASGKFHNELTAEETTEFELLLHEDGNKKLFQDLKETGVKIQHTKPLTHTSLINSRKRIWAYFRERRIRLFINLSKYAAIIILAFVLATVLNVGNRFKTDNPGIAEINVPFGQMTQLKLFDGTLVWLNSGTTLKYENDFGEKNRIVMLQGEAFFKVKHDKLPFKVKLKNSEIEVLGTSFNVVSYPDEVFSTVTLVEGKVKINDSLGKEILQLKPSEQISMSDDLKQITRKKVNTKFYVSWTQGKIVFEEERLADISERLERWYNVDIQFADEQSANYRFTGTILKIKPFNQITTAFELLLPIKIKYTNNLDKKDLVLISKK